MLSWSRLLVFIRAQRRQGLLATSLLAVFFLAAGAHAKQITGAGATFPAPLYAKWAAQYYASQRVQINYQSIGSGAGLKQIEAKTVDFGASDMPLKEAELSAKGLIQFPTVIGGVVPVVNLKGVAPGQLKLTGAVLADIFLGKIAYWTDPAIVALNPGVPLPKSKILPVRRADGSGTTFLFTNYLSKVSTPWRDKVGEGTAVNWPVGAGGKGNEGVAAFVSRLPNSIGYVEYTYVKQNKLNYVQLQNAAGQFVVPSEATFQAAAKSAQWSKDFYQILTNQAGPQAWPLTGATFILLPTTTSEPEVTARVLRFFNWAYTQGEPAAKGLDYVTLPLPVQNQVRTAWGKIQDKSGKRLNWQ
jgi:phosphate transport system substrate-binding protein